MARRLGGKNTLQLKDKISASEIHLYFRMPTTEELVGYRNGGIVREGDEMVNNTAQNRLKYGEDILTGFRKGDFEKKIDDKWVPLSVEKDADWKKQVVEQAADLVEELAVHVFEASCKKISPSKKKDLEGN